MLKSLHIGRYVTNPQHLRVITDFLEAIGLEQIRTENGSRSAIFSAPLGLLSITELSPQHAAEVLNCLEDVNRLIVIEVTNPDTVFEIARRKNLRLLADTASAKTGERSFSVELPGEIVVTIHGISEEAPAGMAGNLNARGRYFAIVLARFNSFITDRLLQGALDALRRTGAAREAIDIVRVPGSFEIPAAARALAETRRYDAIICLGCLLRGETAHYDVIVNEVTRGIGQSAQDTGVPHAFGVLTCDTLEQAIDRAGLKMGNKGFEAGLAAVEMASLKKAAGRQHSSKGKVGGAARSRNQSGKHPRKRSS